ncbi:hypothetical protein PHMEG_00019719 [Phytophthora megakarya]|uniref:Integrase catalytic domain-containing protein n=1 Tax=Phytophthora megakarya TaxID=4795 RepID=A0A225VQW7_9STRA|nr:hypothetical protein PHMEG_00019719 [Phytophthora megakarya]
MAAGTRVSNNLPKFTRKRGEDVRVWLFQVENACRINGIPIGDTSRRLPEIAGSAMEKPASGWFLHWSSTTRSEEHTWGIFREHVLQHFELLSYQAVLREKLQRLKQTADIETYNNEYSALIFRIEGMSVLDQVLSYANGLKLRTRNYVKLENPETLSDVMDLAVKYEVTHFIEVVRDRQPRGDKKKPFGVPAGNTGKACKGKPFRGNGRFKPRADTKKSEGRTGLFCKKPGQIKANYFAWKEAQEKQGNKQPRHLNVLCENPLVYKSRPLFSRWLVEHAVRTTKFSDKSIRVKLGDNQIDEVELGILSLSIMVPGPGEVNKRVAAVYAIPDEFDCILGIPFFEVMQPQIDWRGRRIEGTKSKTLHWERRGRPVDRSRMANRGATRETDVTSAVQPVHDLIHKKIPSVACEQLEDAPAGKGSAVVGDLKPSRREGTVEDEGFGGSTRGNGSVVEKMFTMGVVDEVGVQTKYITRKKLRKFLRIETKSIDEPGFMLVLSNETIKQVARSLERRDQPDIVGSAKAQRYLETEWATFADKAAFDLLAEYKDSVFRPELPEGLPEKRDIDMKDPNLAIYRQQWRQSPEQQREISIPMTRKEDILDAMSGAYWFSTMDLMSGYYQVRMREEDIKFTAFQAQNGLWEYLALPMGVCNAPPKMHRLTSKLFRGLETTKSFHGGIYIFTNKLYVKLSKCVVCAEEIPCLGDFLGRNGVRMDSDKVQTIKDWPVPRTQEELHSFLGLTGYVQRFCPEYASMTASMFTLLKKKNKRNAKICFSDGQLKNFKELKRRLCNPPVLHLPDFKQPMHLRTDASKFAVGGVLFQIVDGIERPIVYTSRKTKSAELNYPTQQQELLAIVHALVAFRIYCLDKPPIVETDHKSLEGLFNQKMANCRLPRWYDILAEYQSTFSYLPGAKNRIADALSRRLDLQPETKFFHDLSVTSFDDTSYSLAISEVTTDIELVSNIKKALTKRCHFVPTMKKVTAEGVARLFIEHIWKLHGMPTNIVSDRDRKFVSAFWQDVFKSVGTKLSMTVAYRAQGDGQTERMNRTLEEYLRCFVGPLQDDWDVHLANAEFAVNSTVNSSTKLALFEADPGYIPLNPLYLTAERLDNIPKSRRGAEVYEHYATIRLRCREALAQAQERMRNVYDRNRAEQEFEVGDRMYLSTRNLDRKHTSLPNLSKVGPKWMGLYSIVLKMHNHAYELSIQSGN